MSSRTIHVPDSVRQKCMALGKEGLKWLDDLKVVIDKIEKEWGIKVESTFEGGSEGYVAGAKTKEGKDVILKIAMPEMEGNGNFTKEVTILQIANGHGYAKLLAYNFQHRAMLLERLGVPLCDLGVPALEQINILCSTLKKTWVKVLTNSQLQTGDRIADELSQFITSLWNRLDQPCSKRAIDKAKSFAQSRKSAYSHQKAVLVHGDAHSGNVLLDMNQKENRDAEFKFIDPDGLIAEPAYDLGVLMREWVEELIHDPVQNGLERCELLHTLTGIERQAIWEWGYIQCISTGLFLIHLGQKQAGRQMLIVAEAWARHDR